MRLDVLLVERGLAPSRSRARSLIEAGVVQVDGIRALKPSLACAQDAHVQLSGIDHRYVSRGGLKLEGALDDLSLDVSERVAADLGASTGGFTDCLLSRGAARVYAIDVGHDQLHARLRADPRVIAMEGVNARYLQPTDLPEPVDLVVIDASFISLKKLLPAALGLLRAGGEVLALVKPQFEVGPAAVGKRGVVRDEAVRRRALDEVVDAARELGLPRHRSVDSRLAGPEGNREIFVHWPRS